MKSNESKKKSGSYRSDREKRVRAAEQAQMLIPNDYLNDQAKKRFEFLKAYIRESQVTHYTVDSSLLNMTAFWWAVYDWAAQEAFHEIATMGPEALRVTHSTGAIQVNTTWTIVKSATDYLMKCFKLMGIGPYNRSKIQEFLDKIESSAEPEDEFG